MKELNSELISQSKEAIDLIEKSGVIITPMPAKSDLEEFYRVGERVAQELSGEVYPRDLLDRVYKILDRVRKSP